MNTAAWRKVVKVYRVSRFNQPEGWNMEYGAKVLDIDPEKISAEIARFIIDTLRHFFRKKGIVIGLSGGIDSAVAAALSVKALGKERVFSVLLPEKDSDPVSREYGRLVAESLGIECEEIDMTPMIDSFGVYEKRNALVKEYFPGLEPPFKFRLVLPQDLLDRDRINVYYLEVLMEDGNVERKRLSHGAFLGFMAANDIKQRMRMTQLYYEAERRNYIVCGTTNRSEVIQGFFVKFGDGGVDIEPLASLYKTQVYQIARYLGLPREVIDRTPSPDTYSLKVSDEDFYFCLPYDRLDMVLYAMDHDIPRDKVVEVLGLSAEQVDRIWHDLTRKREATEHLRELPPTPKIDCPALAKS